MIIQVNHDNHIEGSAELTKMVQALIQDQLARFSAQITRIEVHFSDESGAARSADIDKRCLLEARLAGMQPISVSDEGPSIDYALRHATSKMESLIESTLAKLGRP